MIHCFATTSFEIVLHFLHSWSLLNIMLLCILMMHFKSMVLFLKCLTALMQLHSVRCTAHVIQCNVHCAMCNIHCLLHCAVQCSAVQYSSILLIVVQGARWWWGGAMEWWTTIGGDATLYNAPWRWWWWWCSAMYTVGCTMVVQRGRDKGSPVPDFLPLPN